MLQKLLRALLGLGSGNAASVRLSFLIKLQALVEFYQDKNDAKKEEYFVNLLLQALFYQEQTPQNIMDANKHSQEVDMSCRQSIQHFL